MSALCKPSVLFHLWSVPLKDTSSAGNVIHLLLLVSSSSWLMLSSECVCGACACDCSKIFCIACSSRFTVPVSDGTELDLFVYHYS